MIWKPTKETVETTPLGPVSVATEAVAVQKDLKDFVRFSGFLVNKKWTNDDIFLGLFFRFRTRKSLNGW